ncbi:MAG TPA: DUF2336 domain-containing protein [Aliidongia sp.]|uniref:DUF2336 domain-containing protein n=1 Tax=Aliidongia sp. TaxID=1914230 RepID=UPI002DDD6FBE|nr:DUF2336 domain-containing protein [Aliidongia sp.]HEV2675805.1 DUF2336 domain-containing protein [Aliidongia sp.]
MLRDAIRRLFGRAGGDRATSVPFDKAKALVRHGDPAVRRSVAADPQAAPELLFFLARDQSPQVRAAVAIHPKTPRQADLLLALDEQPEIRTLVAEKIAGQAHQLSSHDAAQLWQLTIRVLEALARDDLPWVRQLVAETARGIPEVPSHLMTELGRDRTSAVAVPALGFVGDIADGDLVGIVEHAPDEDVIGAVARRSAIGPAVTDAVVEHGSPPSVAILLANHKATFAPETLDRVVERAAPVEIWHEPLVGRPQLTDGAAVRLASFVADRLVQALRSRPDLDPETNAAIEIIIHEREAMPGIGPTMTITTEVDENHAVTRARRMFSSGQLNEEAVLEVLDTDRDFLIAALSLRSKLPPAVVAKILSSHSAKGLTALTWKAGFTMRLALQLQLRVAHLPPKARMIAGGGGTFPLSAAELEWQIEFFRTLVPSAN